MDFIITFFITSIFLVIFFHDIYGTTIWNNSTKVINNNGTAGDWFGNSVARNRDYVVVGSPGNGKNGKTKVGAISVYTVNGTEFKLKDKLVPSDGQANDAFGYSVQVNINNYIVTGSFRSNNYRGSAYIYHQDGTGWTNQKIVANDGAQDDSFGLIVDINDNNEVVVGAHQDDDKGYNAGSAYIFTFNNNKWTQSQKLVPKDLSHSDNFGRYVSITMVYLAVCADYQDSGSGSVYIYTKKNNNQWEQQTKLTSPNKQNIGWFGNTINVHDKRIIIAAVGEDSAKGNVYIYVTDGISWKLESTLQASDGKISDWFGQSVAMDNNNIVIGAIESDNNEKNSGSVYVYQLNDGTWQETVKLIAADGKSGDSFGFAVNIFNNEVVVGSRKNYANGAKCGAIYIFKHSPLPMAKVTPSSTTELTTTAKAKITPSSKTIVKTDSTAKTTQSSSTTEITTHSNDFSKPCSANSQRRMTVNQTLTIALTILLVIFTMS